MFESVKEMRDSDKKRKMKTRTKTTEATQNLQCKVTKNVYTEKMSIHQDNALLIGRSVQTAARSFSSQT